MSMLTIGSLIAKSTFVLAAAAVAVLGMRRRSAAARHLVWSIALTAVLVLPLLAVVEPAWRVAMPPLPRALSQEVVGAPMNFPPPVASKELVPGRAAGEGRPAEASASVQSSGQIASAPVQSFGPIAPAPVQSSGTVAPAPVATHSHYTLAQLAALIWLLGVVLFVTRMLLAMLAMARIARRSTPVAADPRLRKVLGDAICRCAVHDVELRMSREVDLPATWGLTRPLVLVPADATEWTLDRWSLVLAHELAHVERRDVWMHIVARFARAIHWINPLAWYAERELRLETE